ncbi:hypothetical protein C8Q76DRAFT_597751, partial [Earliella scabrosa]
FAGLHFSYYSRYSTKGHDAPPDVHPLYLRRANTTRSNDTQGGPPYLTKECRIHQREYNNLCVALDEVFEWIQNRMEDRFPELTVTISALARLTPGNDRAPAYPFSGFVINLNSYTKVHRDGLDLGGCLVMAIGKFAGGEL